MTSSITDRPYGLSASVAVKAPCLWVATAPNALSGLGGVIGGTPAEGDRVLVMGNNDGRTNGIYNASVLAWKRAGDFDGPYDCVQGTLVVVYYGTGLGLFFQLATPAPIINATPLLFQPLNNYFNYFPITAAEGRANVTPINLQYPEGTVLRYATNTTPGVTDMFAAIRAAILVSAWGGAPAALPPGIYGVSSDLNPSMGAQYLQGGSGPFAASIFGGGSKQTEIRFIAGGVLANGICFNGGGNYLLGGVIQGVQINGNNLAPRGLSVLFGDTLVARDLIVRNCAGPGIFIDNSIDTELDQVLLGGNGSATTAQLEIDGSLIGSSGGTTTTTLRGVYVSGKNQAATTSGGVKIDRANNTMIFGGAIESTGSFGLSISSKHDASNNPETHACASVVLIGTDFENITDRYIDAGYGLANTSYVTGLSAANCTGQGSGAAQTPYAVKLSQSNGARFTNNAWGQPGSPTATYFFETAALRTTIDEHPANFGSGYPWVMRNGVWIKGATPLVKYNSHESPNEPFRAAKAVSGTSFDAIVDAAQGGYYEQLNANNGSATNVTTIVNVPPGGRVYIKGEGNSTLIQGTGANQPNNKSGANFLLVNGQEYCYMNNGTCLDQI